MKGLKLFFAACLAPLAFQPAVADDASDIARAGTRRPTAQNASTVRQRQKTDIQKPTASAVTPRTTKTGATTVRERDKNTQRTNAIQSDTKRGTTTTKNTDDKTVSARTTSTNIQSRVATNKNRVVTRDKTPKTPNISRTAISTRNAPQNNIGTSRTSKTPTRNITRSATAARTATRDDILSRNFSKCRDVFHSCMDEFCANKDSQLRRCACSSRANEFEYAKRQLAQAEDKLLDFSERLITVNMDKEDVTAMNQATEGELAFAADDKSESKKLLDQIAKKLNTSFNDSNFDNNLNAINLSLNTDSAFDNVDSLMGSATTTKSGTDLYVSALPVCREMAMEVCSPDELEIAESGYQMSIEQDCNTVAKSYQSQTEQTRNKVFESGALLDMSRLDIHQQRNSDDILTCKRKMLDALSDTSVCGDGLGKCLDTSGRYIDPTTGTAFLTQDLSDLGKLITRPSGEQTWTSAPGNDKFISFLETKKTFLEPAMEKCQDIADNVWDSFIEDALAQIKLAQEKKLEEVRQSCTTLTAECLSAANKTIQEFDARALSIFGIEADKTVNAMCENVKTACNALFENTTDKDTTESEWIGGMSQIATEITHDTIMHTCREVGRNCIIQACKSTSGNFGLCEDIYTSINRKSILNRTACWDEVVQCVSSAGADALNKIQQGTIDSGDFRNGHFYYDLYRIEDIEDVKNSDCSTTSDISNCVYDICHSECDEQTTMPVSDACYTCRLAERIWGNCEYQPANINNDNRIKNAYKEDSNDLDKTRTLQSWFAYNTGTANKSDSCRDYTCKPGYTYDTTAKMCIPSDNFTTTGATCDETHQYNVATINNTNITDCCNNGIFDSFGNCCADGQIITINTTPTYKSNNDNADDLPDDLPKDKEICVPSDVENAEYIAQYYIDPESTTAAADKGKTYHVFCLGGSVDATETGDTTMPRGSEIECNGGDLIIIDSDGVYYKITAANKLTALATAKVAEGNATCELNIVFTNNDMTTRQWENCTNNSTAITPDNYKIKYQE
ncbi:MAG: hypothetical protein IJ273_00995 [Alphaproteobacteria bacterium]|nr:hypothetical protein [Alphaproteobacteria bacterium]